MSSPRHPTLSIVVPIYNEGRHIADFHQALTHTLKQIGESYEVIYCNDGSTDGTLEQLHRIAKNDTTTRILSLSRNFGKEIATTAGIHAATGDAILMIDSDGQHPVELIPAFIKRWKAGAKVVVGARTKNNKEGLVKRLGSKLFYLILSRLIGLKLVPGATDFRLIDSSVQRDFLRMTERNRITRGLIDWIGYKQEFIEFTANPRQAGEATYSFKKLVRLAVDSFISLSVSPLYVMAYIGAFVLCASALLGVLMLVNLLSGDVLHLHATGSSYIIVIVLFLVGVLLVSQGIMGLYLSHIHAETQNRPLYIIDQESSVRHHASEHRN